MNTSMAVISSVNKLNITEPTFVAASKSVLPLCTQLSQVFNTNYAYIERRVDETGSKIVLCGHVNPNTIFITHKPRNLSFYAEEIELIWCAGADNIYLKSESQLSERLEFKKLVNPYLNFPNKVSSI